MKLAAIAVLCLVLPTQAAVHHSSDFGWKSGQDVTDAFSELLQTGRLKTGDQFIFEHAYRMSGTHELPDGFTLSAKQGAGIEVTDAETHGPILILGHQTVLRNLTIHYLGTPALGPQGTNPQHEEHFTRKTGILANGKDDIRIENCRLIGSISHHIKLAGRCNRPRIVGCHIRGGFWTIYLSANDAVLRHCVIEDYQGDGIKTDWAKRPLVDTCVFQDGGRDGIDTTGGWDESVVRNTIFRRLLNGFDLKSGYGNEADLDSPENVGMLIEKCRFIDVPSGITLSTLDRGLPNVGRHFLNAENAEKYAPHDLDINDCVFGHVETPRAGRKAGGYGVDYPSEAGEHMRMLTLKGAHSIRYRNARFFGDGIELVGYFNTYEIFGPESLSEEAAAALNHGVIGTVAGAAEPAEPGDRSVPFSFGPQPTE